MEVNWARRSMSKLMRAWFVTSSEQTVWEVVAEESGEGEDIPESGLEIVRPVGYSVGRKLRVKLGE